MKLLLMADTHGQNDLLEGLPFADVAIHCGDLTHYGNRDGLREFAKAYSQVNATYKIAIAGNHDGCFVRNPQECRDILSQQDIFYLEDSGITLNGVKFWGMPWTLRFGNWFFMADETHLMKRLDMAPDGGRVDVLITHGPPHGILDRTVENEYAGSYEQHFYTSAVIRPALSVFGHIHEGYGHEVYRDIDFINCSLVNEYYRPTNRPVEYEFLDK